MPFDLTVEWVEEALERGTCAATGLEFKWDDTGKAMAFSASIDRIVPDKGYVLTNCQVVLWAYNGLKGNDPPAVALQVAMALLENQTWMIEIVDGKTSMTLEE